MANLIETMAVSFEGGLVAECGIVSIGYCRRHGYALHIIETPIGFNGPKHMLVMVHRSGARYQATAMKIVDSSGWSSVVDIFDHFAEPKDVDAALSDGSIQCLTDPVAVS